MRRDKTVARVLLIFSVANIALAAPAVVRQRHMDVAETGSGKRGEEATGSEPVPEPVPEPHRMMHVWSGPSGYLYHSWDPPMYHDSALAPPPASFHGGPGSSIHWAWWPFGDENYPTYHESALAPPPPSPPPPPPPPPPEAAPPAPDGTSHHDPAAELPASSLLHPAPTVFTDAVNKKLMTIAAWSAVVGLSAAAAYAVHKEIEDNHSPKT